jgi:hypothetical protein
VQRNLSDKLLASPYINIAPHSSAETKTFYRIKDILTRFLAFSIKLYRK